MMHTELPRAGRASIAVQLENDSAHADWDDFLERTPGGDLAQASSWGRVKAQGGMETHRVVVRADDTIVGGAQLLARRARRVGAIAYVAYGPVIAPRAPRGVSDALVHALIRLVREQRVRAVFVQPCEGGDGISELLRAAGFEPSDANVAPSASLRLDVRRDEEALVAAMSKWTRVDMRRSLRQPLEVRRAGREDLRSFHDLHTDSARRQGFSATPLAYLESLWDELTPRGHIGLFLVAADGTDVAGLLVSRFGDTVTNRLSGFAPGRVAKKLRPNEALTWSVMRWARGTGTRWYDLGGVGRHVGVALANGADPGRDDLRGGPWGHKVALGGIPVVYPEPLGYVPHPALRRVYRFTRSSEWARRVQHVAQAKLRAASQRGTGT